jgi:PilZ domain
MNKKKAYVPPCLTVYDPPKIPELGKNRLYTRYPFTAEAKISSSGAVMPARVTNISFGGCRLLTNGRVPVNTALIQ